MLIVIDISGCTQSIFREGYMWILCANCVRLEHKSHVTNFLKPVNKRALTIESSFLTAELTRQLSKYGEVRIERPGLQGQHPRYPPSGKA